MPKVSGTSTSVRPGPGTASVESPPTNMAYNPNFNYNQSNPMQGSFAASAPGYPGPSGVASAPMMNAYPQQNPGYASQAGYGYSSAQPPAGVSADLWQWFQAVDADRSGRISAVELKGALANGNYTTFNEGTCRLMIKLFDKDNSGTIDVHEFAALWKYISDWRDCFNRFDQDRSGSISSSELTQALSAFGYRLSPQFCQTLVKTYSGRRVGAATSTATSIGLDDFIEACVTIKNLTDTFRRYDPQQQGVIQVGFEQFLDMVSQSVL